MGILDVLPFVSTGLNAIQNLFGYEENRRNTSINQDISNQNFQLQQQYNEDQKALALQNMALQKEFAQKGITWRVADAKAAGIHPLAALGVQPISYSPTYVGGQAAQKQMVPMGQNISRALSALQTPMEKYANIIRLQQEQERLKLMKLQVLGAAKRLSDLDNKPLVDADGVIQGQGDVLETDLLTGSQKSYNLYKNTPAPTGFTYNETKVPYSSQRGFQAGSDPYWKYTIGAHGEKIPVLSDPNEEKIESMNMRQYIQDMAQIKRMLGGLWYKYAPKFLQPPHHRKRFYKDLEDYRPKDGIPRRYDPWTDSWFPIERR